MKKLITMFGFLLIVGYSFGQATAVGEFRVATMTTDFGVNLPIGSKIFCIADSSYWGLTAPVITTDDLTSATRKVRISNGLTSGTVTSVASGNGMNFTTITGTGTVTMGTPGALSGTSTDGVTTTSHTHSITTGAVTDGGTAIPEGNDVYDFVTGLGYQVATVDHDTSMTNEGKLTVEAGDANTAEIHSNTSTSTDVTIGGAGIVTVTENTGTGTITVTGTEVDGSTTNELQTLATTSDATSNTTTLSNSGGSQKLVEGTGITLTTTGTGLDGIVTVAASASALGVTTPIVQWVEVAADDLTLPYPVTMAQTPATTTNISIQINGQTYKYAAGTTPGTFNFTGTALSIYVPVYKYDTVEIRYSY